MTIERLSKINEHKTKQTLNTTAHYSLQSDREKSDKIETKVRLTNVREKQIVHYSLQTTRKVTGQRQSKIINKRGSKDWKLLSTCRLTERKWRDRNKSKINKHKKANCPVTIADWQKKVTREKVRLNIGSKRWLPRSTVQCKKTVTYV